MDHGSFFGQVKHSAKAVHGSRFTVHGSGFTVDPGRLFQSLTVNGELSSLEPTLLLHRANV
jgi:hypothetical protein